MDKEQTAIMRLRQASEMSLQVYRLPLVLTDSGGKDSSVCLELAKRARIPFEVIHNFTTADAPETVDFVKREFHKLELEGIRCAVNYPVYKGQRVSMWSLIPQKLFPPTRRIRYCCSIMKEQGGTGRFIATGVRWAESPGRKENRGIYETGQKVILGNDNDDRRRLFEGCRMTASRVCNPIIDWEDGEVWVYIESEGLAVNPLYRCGFSRVGCIGCPLAGKKAREREFFRYPRYRENYIRAFERMLEERKRRGRTEKSWGDGMTGKDVFHWWMEDGELPGQMDFEDLEGEED